MRVYAKSRSRKIGVIIILDCQENSKKLRMPFMEGVYHFTLISGGKLARDHLSSCSKYLGKPEKNRGREWGQKAQTKFIENNEVKNRAVMPSVNC